MKYIGENLELFIAIVGGILGLIVLIKEKSINLLLTKLNLRSSKSKINKDTIEADDKALEMLKDRVDAMAKDYVKLSETNNVTQKENFNLKSRLSTVEYECGEMKRKISRKCDKNCFDV